MPLPLLLIAAAAGSAGKGLATLGSGFMEARANKAKGLGAQIERDMALLRGKQIGVQSREQLQTALGTLDAIRSTRGASLDSQTGRAIERRTIQDNYRDEAAAVLAELTRAGAASQAMNGYRSAARWSIPLSVLNSSGDFANAYSYGSAAMGGK